VNPGPEAFFIDAGPGRPGQRFCLHHRPASAVPRAAVLYVHPFAEEMNKSRRMAALQARRFASEGLAVLQLDMLGCGDSSGEFGDATWDDWIADVLLGLIWLRQRHSAPLWIWGLRAGCLLAAEAASEMQEPVSALFWQPPASGKAILQQFLRLKSVADAIQADSAPPEGNAREQLASGQSVEIAGYEISPALADGLQRSQLKPWSRLPRARWLELSTRTGLEPLPATLGALQLWQQEKVDADLQVLSGPPFWQTQEIVDAPAMVDASVQAMLPAVEAL
jgi:exosortase A-associated hydrolase 2